MRESEWSEKNGRVKTSTRKKEKKDKKPENINAFIAEKVAEVENEILELTKEGRRVGAALLKQRLVGEDTKRASDFFLYAESVTRQFERQSKLYTAKRYRSICRKFERFAGRPLAFDTITPSFLREYETHLIEKYGNKPNTVATNFRCIRAIIYRAIRDGFVEQGENPFFHYRIKTAKPNRAKLTLEQIRAIEALGLTPGALVWHVRNYFLFSFYCGGIRFGDVAKMKCSNVSEGRLMYTMSKTGKQKSIKLVKQAREIIAQYFATDPDRYLFPILRQYDTATPKRMLNAISAQNVIVNKCLKRIGKQASILEPISFHISRHSFADMARTKGWGVYDISKALGHSDLKTTERYLRGFDSVALDQRMEELFTEMDA